MKKILVPTDFSDCAGKAFQYAVQVAGKTGAEIILLHVFHLLKYPFADKKELVKEYNRIKVSELSTALQRLKDEIKDKTVKITPSLSDGEVVDSILAASKTHDVDLMVMGTLGITGLKTLIFGTNTAAVIKESSIPVITIPYNYELKEIKDILIAVNNNNEDIKIFEPVFILSQVFSAKIKIVVFSDEDAEAVELVENSTVAMQIQRNLRKQFSETEIEKVHLCGYDFYLSIHEYIEEKEMDLLVMITYKRTFLQNLFNFSMTRKMANHTRIPLMSLQGTLMNDAEPVA
jgi:nucleotide-binding universal stress UspA family protein